MTSQLQTAAIGLGSNLGDRAHTLSMAASSLARIGRELRRSQLYESAPVGPPQPDYLNAVVLVATELDPESVMRELLAIEASLGRIRRERWGPRTIDLDLLALGAAVVVTPSVTLPHPELATRAFVLKPWAEIAPEMIVPGLGTVVDLLQQLPDATRQTVSLFERDW